LKRRSGRVGRANPEKEGPFLRGAGFLISIAVCFYFAGGGAFAGEGLKVAPSHPRILFRQEELTSGRALARRCLTERGPTEEFAPILQWCRSNLGSPFNSPDEAEKAMVIYAFAYEMTEQQPGLARKALEIAMSTISRPETKDPSFRWQSLPRALAIVFDWCYNRMDEEEKKLLLKDLIRRGIYIREVVNGKPHSAYSDVERVTVLLFIGAAVYGEGLAGERPGEWLLFAKKTFEEEILAARDEVGWQGGWPGSVAQNRKEQPEIAEALEVWLSATGENYFTEIDSAWKEKRKPGSDHLRGAARFWIFSTRPDFRSEKKGDTNIFLPSVDSCHIFHLASRYHDRLAQGFALMLKQEEEKSPPESDDPAYLRFLEGLMKEILWKDENLPPLAIEQNLPQAALFEDSGNVYIRSGWNFGEGSRDVWAVLRCESGAGGNLHHHQGHLSIVRGSDSLLIDSGCLDEEGPLCLHLERYFRSGLAHNILLSGSADQIPRPEGLFPVGYASSDEAYRGTITAFTDRPAYVYAAANSSFAYEPSQIWESRRQLVYLKDEDIFVVFDRAYSISSSFEPLVLWHTIEEPSVSGTRRIISGKEGEGISKYRGTKAFLIRRGSSKLVGQWLYPQRGVVTKIGGKGFEFYKEGNNLAPGPLWKSEDLEREEAGAWRLEFRPEKRGSEQIFLFVLAVRGRQEPALFEAKLIADEELIGAELRAGKTYRLYFSRRGKASGRIEFQGISEKFPEEITRKIARRRIGK